MKDYGYENGIVIISLFAISEGIMKKNKLSSLLMIGLCSAMLVGCSKENQEVVTEAVVETEERNMFGLTDSQQKVYAEYAAGVLMKYNAGSNMRVLEGKKLTQQEEKEQAVKEQEEKRAKAAAEYEANKNKGKKENQSSSSSSNSSSSSAGGIGISYISDMATATGMDSFSITYDGYEIADSYPNSGEDVFLAMDAREGNLFLVTKYRVTNTGGQTENFNMFSKQAKFKVDLNGERYRSQYTLLLDDLSMYKGDVEAGETIETILLFEIPEAAAANISDMVLSITVGDEVNSMQLQGGSGAVWTETATEVEKEQDNVGADVQENYLESNDENTVNSEYNDLAEEYLNAIEAENAGMSYEEYYNSEGGNVTVVGSNRN